MEVKFGWLGVDSIVVAGGFCLFWDENDVWFTEKTGKNRASVEGENSPDCVVSE